MFSEWLWSQQTQRENPSNSLNKKTQLTHQTDRPKNGAFLQVWNNEAGADGGEMADLSFGIFRKILPRAVWSCQMKRKYEMFFPYGTHGNGRKFMIVEIPLFTGFYTFQVVQKFFQQWDPWDWYIYLLLYHINEKNVGK